MGTEPFEPYRREDEYDWDYEDEPRGPQPKILWGRVVALGAVLLAAFILGRWTAPAGIPEDEIRSLEAKNADLENEIEELNAKLDKQKEQNALPSPTASPTDDTEPTGNVEEQVYVVKSGDTWVDIAEKLYGDPSLAECIADANGLSLEGFLRTGTELVIPDEDDC